MPLAGDQGAGLGVYQHNFMDLKWPNHLLWGRRTLGKSDVDGIVNGDINTVKRALYDYGIVNIVRGPMEFGPRALCNTTTLALPGPEQARMINIMNDRTNEMPMALVMTQNQADTLFERCDRVYKSLEYMVITRRFKHGLQTGLEGGAHYYPLEDAYTCRPQITSDPFMVSLLDEFGPLINTSFNFHGQPIVYDLPSIEYAHGKEHEKFDIATIIMED